MARGGTRPCGAIELKYPRPGADSRASVHAWLDSHGWQVPGERLAHRAAHGTVDSARVGEAHLGLARVNVDVDVLHGKLEENHRCRKPTGLEQRLVGAHQGVGEPIVGDRATVDEPADVVAVGPLVFRRGEPARNYHRAEASLYGQPMRRHLSTEHLMHPLRQDGYGRRRQQRALAVPEPNVNIRAAQGVVHHRLSGMTQLGRRLLEVLAARRRVEEQIRDPHGGAARPGKLREHRVGAAVHAQAHARPVARSGGELDAGYGSDARQGFTPKPHGVDGVEVLDRLYLAGGVLGKGELDIASFHTVPVVNHLDKA